MRRLFYHYRNQKQLYYLALAIIVGLLGVYALRTSGALTLAVATEAESGQLAGNAGAGDPQGASGGASIKFGAGGGSLPPLPNPGTYNTTVNFGTTIAQLDQYSFSSTVSGYGTAWTVNGTGQCTNIQCANMKKLGLGMYRVSIQWNNGNPVSGAGGNGTGGPSGDQLIDTIRATGAEPVLVIGGKGGANDMDFTDADARNLVQHYSSGKYTGANAVRYYVVGNEPSNSNNGNMSIAQFCTKFNSSATAMRQANPDIKLIGPAWPYYNLDVIKQFLQCAGDKVDVIDYHAYGQSSQGIDQNIQGSALLYEQQNKDVRAAINSIVPGRANQIAHMVGEYNVSPFASSDTNDERFYTGGTTVWNALATGSILKGGARAFIFSDQNNPIGLIFQQGSIAALYGRQQGDLQPAYHGIGMFSGEGLFRRFGTAMVQASSTDPDIVAFASNNSKNLVLVNKNKDTAKTANVRLDSFGSGRAAIWQTDKNKPFDYPAKKGDYVVNGGFAYNLPSYSVTTVILD